MDLLFINSLSSETLLLRDVDKKFITTKDGFLDHSEIKKIAKDYRFNTYDMFFYSEVNFNVLEIDLKGNEKTSDIMIVNPENSVISIVTNVIGGLLEKKEKAKQIYIENSDSIGYSENLNNFAIISFDEIVFIEKEFESKLNKVCGFYDSTNKYIAIGVLTEIKETVDFKYLCEGSKYYSEIFSISDLDKYIAKINE